ncbi:hypothetical protein P153DRAFT_361124 [Dothidotthia symphoricarpi CBS 119687]|uniref:Uncharacterized protein n=1 Tax=Dothidotthia symphoricarpi CBS 119687 TaxID=1392245 RepID=A0A6A6A118_9PLEO|nr:uncharacterized protein P153DRAFT_361124 [Dothidotthia symphoricarpi CBS 119687]KAF2124408.1 hypothetical protein P153DRAFT_361124 [Dothidotthia symphoricarpi CBS 119687]
MPTFRALFLELFIVRLLPLLVIALGLYATRWTRELFRTRVLIPIEDTLFGLFDYRQRMPAVLHAVRYLAGRQQHQEEDVELQLLPPPPEEPLPDEPSPEE